MTKQQINSDISQLPEDFFKQILVANIEYAANDSLDLILTIQSILKDLNMNSSIPRVWIQINNKYMQLSREFSKKGISIYSNLNGINVLGASIYDDLMNIGIKSNNDLVSLSSTLKQEISSLAKLEENLYTCTHEKNPFKKLFIKSKFSKLQNETEFNSILSNNTINSLIQDCITSDKLAFNYTLDDKTILRAVNTFFSTSNFSSEQKEVFLEEVYAHLDALELPSTSDTLKEQLHISCLKPKLSFKDSLKFDVDTSKPNPITSNNSITYDSIEL